MSFTAFCLVFFVLVLAKQFAPHNSSYDVKKPSPFMDLSFPNRPEFQKMAVIVTWIGCMTIIRWIWTRPKRHTIGNSPDDQVLAPASSPSVATSVPSEMVASTSTLSSSSAVEWKYDVFLSFRGPDTRKSITYELYDRLQNMRGIKTFMDDQDLEVGDPISPTLLKAIEESRFAIVVLSPKYASSTWCLEELVKICECMEDHKRILPLFYNVEPSDVRYQKMSFEEAFIKHERSARHTSEKVQQWKDALGKVASFSGWHTDNFKTDRELVDYIVDFVCSKIQSTEIMLTMATGDFQAFEATRKAMDDVLKAFQDDNVTALGVYGMGGVGKTTMVKHVCAEACKKRIFDRVVVVVVSQSPHLKNMQETFAEELGFDFQENLTESGRASRLYKEIMRKNNILIILDDIWEYIDLSRIGIPSYDELKKCNSKVLLTTRRLHVSNSMTQVSIPLSILSDKDSWTLFVTKSRRSFESTEFNDIAKKVAKECKGLPIALITVARALGDKDLVEWEKAAQRLEKSQSATLDDEQDAYECIKFSYEYLKDEDSKACFLLCCLFPEDSEIVIEDLFRYGIGIGLFRDTETIYEARGRAESVVKYLIDSSLLLDGGDDDMCVIMHDVIRDIAIKIAKSVYGHGFSVKAGRDLKEWPRISPEGYIAVSLMENNISRLPLRLVCPKLQILLLNSNRYLEKFPETFFQSLNELRVLDLSGTAISVLPQSFGLLTNLQALYLDHCRRLTDISMVGKLTKLEILQMEDVKLEELPRELGELTNLRVLDINGGKIARIPSKVISRLHNLEELNLEYRFCDWESRVDGEGDETNASFDEVTSLSKLSVLKAWISNEECIPKNFELNLNWVRFSICIGEENLFGSDFFDHSVIYLNLDTISNLPGWFFKAEELVWNNCPRLTDVFVEYDHGRLHGLIDLNVRGTDSGDCEPMNSVTWVPQKPMLKNLEVLRLRSVDCQEICELPTGSLFKLQHLQVKSCRNWGNNVLLPSTLLRRPTNLEVLHCHFMKEIEYVFPYKAMLEPTQSKLRDLSLHDLVALRSICDGPAPPTIFQNLQSLSIERCNNLEGSLFTSDAAQCLFQLEYLGLQNCPILERIVEVTEKIIILPKLEMLKLEELPMLYYESTTMVFECPSLQDLYVGKCPKFQVSAPDFRSRNQLQVHKHWDIWRSSGDEEEESDESEESTKGEESSYEYDECEESDE